MEPLEPRLLLSADGLVPFAVGMVDSANDLTLRLDHLTQKLQAVDNATAAIVAEQDLDRTSEVVITGTDGDDRLAIASSLSSSLAISFDAGAGRDTLVGRAVDSTWNVTGAGSGSVLGVAFSGVENLTGAADNEDTFVFEDGGSLSGIIAGGDAGFDTLDIRFSGVDTMVYDATGPDSGAVTSDGNVIAFVGLEPVMQAGAANLTITASTGTANDDWKLEISNLDASKLALTAGGVVEPMHFAPPSSSLTIELGDGNDTLTIGDIDVGGFTLDKLTYDGEAGTNKIVVRVADVPSLGAGTDFELSNSKLKVGTDEIDLISVQQAELAGGTGENTFKVAGWTGAAELSGLDGDDVYAFGLGRFGAVEIDGAKDANGTGPDAVGDTLDFTPLGSDPGLTVTNGGATISNGTDTITQTGGNAEEIDAALSAQAVVSLDQALEDLESFVRQLKEAPGELQALRNQLPLLDREEVAGLADVVALTDAIAKFVEDARTEIQGKTRLSTAVAALNLLSDKWLAEIQALALAPFTKLTLDVTTSYRGEQANVDTDLSTDDRLELLLDFALHAEATKTFDKIDLGEDAQNTGVGIDGSITANGTLDANFSIGVSTGAAPTAFLAPGGTFGLEVHATANLSTQPINLSFLELEGSGDLELGGRLGLTLVDADGTDDGRIDPASFDPNLVQVGTPTGTLGTAADPKFFESSVTVSVVPGLEVDGTDLSDLDAGKVTFDLSLPAGSDPFGDDATGVIQPEVEINAETASDPNLDLLDFSNISPSEILGMLEQVSDLLGGISGSEFLATPIPFTELTLGDVLDFGQGFKQSVIDPLFKSGDSLKPDNNGDGAVDGKDLNFSSIQQLGEHLAETLGLDPGGSGAASNLSFTPQYISKGDVAVRAKTSNDESVQLVTVLNAAGGTFKLKLGNATTDAIAFDAPASVADETTPGESVEAKLNDALGAGTVTGVSVSPKGTSGRVYEITFASDPGSLLLELIKDGGADTLVSAGNKELSLRIEYTPSFGFGEARVGTELEGGDGITEVQTVTLNAVESATGDGLDDTFQLGLRLDPSAPLLFTSNIQWDASAADVESALESLGVTLTGQTLTLRNTGGGDFTLKQDTIETDPIGFDVDVIELNGALLAKGIDATATADGDSFVLTPGTGAAALTLGTIRANRSGSLDPESVGVSVEQQNPEGTAVGAAVQLSEPGKVYGIQFDGAAIAGRNIPQLVSDSSELLGELGLDFGTSLGDLASLTTEGGFRAIASLNAGITFGLDLNPDQELTLAPIVFAPGPAIEVRTITAGDGNVPEVQTVTIRNAHSGTFALTLPGGSDKSTTDPVDIATGNLQTELNKLTDLSGVTVTGGTPDPATGTIVYTITFDKGSGDVPELQAISALLEGAADNGQLAGVNPVTFSISLINDEFDLAGGGVVRSVPLQDLGTFPISVAPSDLTGNTSLADLRDDVARKINEELKAFGLGFFDVDELSTGALAAGNGVEGTGGIAGASKKADVAPLDSMRNDIEFTLEQTQLLKGGNFTGTDQNTLTADLFSGIQVGDQVWKLDTTGDLVAETRVESVVDDQTLTIGELSGGQTWNAGEAFEIRRATEVTGRLRAVDVLDDAPGVEVEPVGGQTGVQTVTIKNIAGREDSFVLGIGSLVTRDISVDAPVDRPFATVTGTNLSQQLKLEGAEGGSFDLQLGSQKLVGIAFDVAATTLDTRLEVALGVDDITVGRTESDNIVTYTIDFGTDPGAVLSVDDSKLRGSSIEEALEAFDDTDFEVQSVTSQEVGSDRVITITFLETPGEELRAGNGTLLDASGALDPAEAGRDDLEAADYVGPLQRAIDAALERLNRAGENAALEDAVFLDYAVDITDDGGFLKLSVSKVTDADKGADTTSGTLELRFRSPVQVDAGGGKITLSTSPVPYSTVALEAASRVERRIEISTDFEDPAYQQLGLLTAPTRFDGTTSAKIDLTLTATPTSGTEQKIHVVVDADTRTSIDELIVELQTAVNQNNGSFDDGDIRVERGDLEQEGNRIVFVGAKGEVGTISMFVPDGESVTGIDATTAVDDTLEQITAPSHPFDAGDGPVRLVLESGSLPGGLSTSTDYWVVRVNDDTFQLATSHANAVAATPEVIDLTDAVGTFTVTLANGAITELGYAAGQGDTKRGKSTAFFVEDTAFSGEFALSAVDVSATATFGFLGIRADGGGSLGDDEFLAGTIDLGLKNPEDGGSRLTAGEIVDALGDGRVFFDAGDLVASGETGILDGGIAADLGFDLTVAPDGFLSGLEELTASLEIGIGSPDWLTARPSLSDPLGFGDAKDKDGGDVDGAIVFTGAADKFALGEAAPENGELDETLSFVISNDGGVTEAVGVLKMDDTQARAVVSTERDKQGKPGRNEVQELRVQNASGGTFKITYNGQTSTRELVHNDTVASMETALKELGFQVTGDPQPNVSVSVSTEAGSGDHVFAIEFVGDLAEKNVDSLGIAEDELARTRGDLQADLQAAIDAALVDLGGTALLGTITATIDGASGEIALAGESPLRIRGNTIQVEFTGPDFDRLLSRFQNLGFRDIIAGLEQAVAFLQTLDGSDGSDPTIPALTIELPLIERSISDLLDPAADFLDFVDEIAADPAGSVQQLNVVLADLLGVAVPTIAVDASDTRVQELQLNSVSDGSFTLTLGDLAATGPIAFGIESDADVEGKIETALEALPGFVGTVSVQKTAEERVVSSDVTYTVTFSNDPGVALSGDPEGLVSLNVLSLDPVDTSILNIDIDFGIGAQLSRPFSLDLADAFAAVELPDFLADFVGVDASGTLSLAAADRRHRHRRQRERNRRRPRLRRQARALRCLRRRWRSRARRRDRHQAAGRRRGPAPRSRPFRLGGECRDGRDRQLRRSAGDRPERRGRHLHPGAGSPDHRDDRLERRPLRGSAEARRQGDLCDRDPGRPGRAHLSRRLLDATDPAAGGRRRRDRPQRPRSDHRVPAHRSAQHRAGHPGRSRRRRGAAALHRHRKRPDPDRLLRRRRDAGRRQLRRRDLRRLGGLRRRYR
jgi:hypothetical protein